MNNKNEEESYGSLITMEIITPEGEVFSGDVRHAKIPGLSGRFTVLPGHMSLITVINPGKIEYYTLKGVKIQKVGPGMVKIEKNHLLVLVEYVE